MLNKPFDLSNKPLGMTDEVYLRYIDDGLNQHEIEQLWVQTLKTREQMRLNLNKEPREVTSSTYERAHKRLTQKVNNMFGM